MKTTLLIAVAAIALMAVLAAIAAASKRQGRARASVLNARNPLTKHEQPMYFRLREAFPDDIVLAQVAFSSLVTAKEQAARNTFNRKVADFVLCDKAFQVRAIIELDDSSHKGREAQDGNRDALLTQAGYRVVRFKHVPDIDSVRTKLADAIGPTPRIEPTLAPTDITPRPVRRQ
jgi:very-short-patch-repair endonuclease